MPKKHTGKVLPGTQRDHEAIEVGCALKPVEDLTSAGICARLNSKGEEETCFNSVRGLNMHSTTRGKTGATTY